MWGSLRAWSTCSRTRGVEPLLLLKHHRVRLRNRLWGRLLAASLRLGLSVFCGYGRPPLRMWLDRPAPRGQQQRGTDHSRDGWAGILTQDDCGHKQKKRRETSRMDPSEFIVRSEVEHDYPSKLEQVAVVILHEVRRRGSSWQAYDRCPHQPGRPPLAHRTGGRHATGVACQPLADSSALDVNGALPFARQPKGV